jgi:hypothetical protein
MTSASNDSDSATHWQWMDTQYNYDKDFVILNVYHLSQNPYVQKLNAACDALGCGAFHVGIEVSRREYSYGSTKNGIGTGIRMHRPRRNGRHKYRSSTNLGKTSLSVQERRDISRQLNKTWLAKDYDTLKHNCIHFAEMFASLYQVRPIPPILNSLPWLGSYIVAPFSVARKTLKQLHPASCSANLNTASCGCAMDPCSDSINDKEEEYTEGACGLVPEEHCLVFPVPYEQQLAGTCTNTSSPPCIRIGYSE